MRLGCLSCQGFSMLINTPQSSGKGDVMVLNQRFLSVVTLFAPVLVVQLALTTDVPLS